jgi:hypothetical protein
MNMRGIEALKAKLRDYRDNPPQYVHELLQAEPSRQQEELLRAAAEPGAHVAVRSGHGTGKTTALAWLALWFVSTRTDCKIPCTAPTAHQLNDLLWPEISKWRSRMPDWYKSQIHVGNDSVTVLGARKDSAPQFVVARTARPDNPEALQGFHAKHLMFLIDEAAGVHERIFQVAEGSLSTKDARVIMTGNPTRLVGYFHRAFHRDRSWWTRLHFSCLDSPIADPEYIERMKQKYGEDSDIYRIRVLGDFPRQSVSQLISTESINAAAGRVIHPVSYHFAPVVMGVDVARFGDDATVFYVRQGLATLHMERVHQKDTMWTASRAAFLHGKHGCDAMFIDDQGLGGGVTDRLRQLGFDPIAVLSNKAAADEKAYFNLRTEMWAKVGEWLAAGGCIPDDEDLRQDLAAPQYGYDSRGRIQLEAKDDTKARLMASPDAGDALALTFAQEVKRKGDTATNQEYRAGRETGFGYQGLSLPSGMKSDGEYTRTTDNSSIYLR